MKAKERYKIYYKRRTKELKKKVHEINKYIYMISSYRGEKKPVKLKCKNCNYTWKWIGTTLVEHIRRHSIRCPKCQKRFHPRKLTNEQFVQRQKKLHPNLKLESKYKGERNKIRVRCMKCGYVWTIRAENLNYNGCPRCDKKIARVRKKKIQDKYFRLSDKEFHEKFYQKYKNHLSLIGGKYCNAHSLFVVQCNNCGYKWRVEAEHALNRTIYCKKCDNMISLTYQNANQRINHIFHGSITLVSKHFKNNCTYVKYHCNRCGYTGKKQLRFLLSGKGCINCAYRQSASRCEKLVAKYLRKKGFKEYSSIQQLKYKKNGFIHSYIPKWLHGLHLDFLLKYHNFYIGIEFDGNQHFYPISIFGGRHGLRYQKHHDRRKNLYCVLNNLPLIRIEEKKNGPSYKKIRHLIRKTMSKEFGEIKWFYNL